MGERASVLVLNGPNLNMLGVREPEIYGFETLGDIEAALVDRAERLDIDIDFRQSNYEGELVSWIQDARGSQHGIIINAAALTHTSIAIRDALAVTDLPVIEVHISNVYKREAFRHTSTISSIVTGVIVGLGSHGYLLALEGLARLMDKD